MPSRLTAADSPPKARTLSNQRRRFSIYQRGQEVTVGPLGFDVPINGDRTAFPTDEVDEEDRLSGVEYPSSDDYEREVKRRRIEKNARDYLCGRKLNLISTTVRGPLEKSYWGQKAKVVGTPLEAIAHGLKKDIIRKQRQKSDEGGTCSLTTSPRVPFRRERDQKITLSQRLLSQQREEPSIVDSQPSIGVTPTPIHYPSSPLAIKAVTPTTGKPVCTLSATVDSVKATKVRLNWDSQEGSIVPVISPRSIPNRSTQKSSSSFIDLTGGGEASGLLPEDGLLFSSSFASPLKHKSKAKLQAKGWSKKGSPPQSQDSKARRHSVETDASELPTSQPEEPETLNIDLDRLGQISKELGIDESGLADETTDIYRHEIKSKGKRAQSPATTLKISLPRIDARSNHKHQAPPSPSADAALRKALKPQPLQRRRGDLGNGVSLNEMIARTAASSKKMSRPKQQLREAQDRLDSISNDSAPEPPRESRNSNPPSAEQRSPTPANVRHSEEPREDEKEEDPDMVPESPIAKSLSHEPIIEPPNTVTQPPIRLSQMPTPLPPSPLTLLNNIKQTAPKIPETVVEEGAEKSPVDVTVKENEPTFHPGPRRPKKIAPKDKLNRVTELKKRSEEGAEVALLPRKIATPVSRLHQKMAEFSPISPMVAHGDVSPMPESQPQPQTEIQKPSIRLQEKLKEGQQTISSQLSSPPPSSPSEARTALVETVQPEESFVEVPATSKETAAAEPEPEEANVGQTASGAPPSPPQEHQERQEAEEESTLEISSSRYRKIEESLNNGVSEALPLALVDETISHISATHPEPPADITNLDETDILIDFDKEIVENTPLEAAERILESAPSTDIGPINGDPTDPEDLDETKSSSPQKAIPIPKTPPADTQTSRISIPESFKKAITAPININFATPSAPPPPLSVPSTAAFTPINVDKVSSSPGSTKIISPASSRADLIIGPFSTIGNDIEFTPFRAIRSPEQTKKAHTPISRENDVVTDFEATEPISPFTFSQFMKPVESQYQVSPAKKANGVASLCDDKPSSYDLENVLGGVEDFLMSDVYDVDEEAKKLSENPTFGDSGGNMNDSRKETSNKETPRRTLRKFYD
ncbi:hypothetical protein TWF730_005937 [Orbilia blumenaviensis]|uniref:Uncharacterized protein n=1 Tax=Orbilia blumenaviensis TaxID=1796055 RepID=A0AAV9VR13_9PEZI